MRQNTDIQDVVQQLAEHCLEHGYKIATAESCTGGWVSHAIVSLPGSSAWFEAGLVTYSNEAKINLLQVSPVLIDAKGAVSEEVARAMLQGVLANTQATHAVAVTGIAGPGGGSPDKPVGLVWFAWGDAQGRVVTAQKNFSGDRNDVRAQAVLLALEGLRDF